MTVKAKQLNGFDHSTEIKKAELALAAAAGRIAAADQDSSDAEKFRDQLIGRLETGDDSITSTELAAADAALRRCQALAVGARRGHQTAETDLQQAVLAATQAAASALALAAPGALAELRDARATAKAAAARVTELETAYATKARAMGAALQAAGASRLAPADPGIGWCGREGSNGAVLGFTVDGLAVTDYALSTS